MYFFYWVFYFPGDDEEDGLGSDVDEGDKEKLKKEKKDDIQRFISAIGEDLNDGGIGKIKIFYVIFI